jgi:hypothetical protein
MGEAAMGMTELKRCPFCYSEPELKSVFIQGSANHKNYFVLCPHCEFRLRNRRVQEGAIGEWNTRPIEDELNARIKELEERLDDIGQDAIERGEYQE